MTPEARTLAAVIHAIQSSNWPVFTSHACKQCGELDSVVINHGCTQLQTLLQQTLEAVESGNLDRGSAWARRLAAEVLKREEGERR